MKKITLQNKRIMITGVAGFIGSNLVLELLNTQSPLNIIVIDICFLLSEWCVVTSFYQSLQAMSSFI